MLDLNSNEFKHHGYQERNQWTIQRRYNSRVSLFLFCFNKFFIKVLPDRENSKLFKSSMRHAVTLNF